MSRESYQFRTGRPGDGGTGCEIDGLIRQVCPEAMWEARDKYNIGCLMAQVICKKLKTEVSTEPKATWGLCMITAASQEELDRLNQDILTQGDCPQYLIDEANNGHSY